MRLRNAQFARTACNEAILDVNYAGEGIHAVELIGGKFNLETAIKPFNPRKPLLGESGGVTYDEEANSAFITFSLKPPQEHDPETALKYSYSITPEAKFAFDLDDGLDWLILSQSRI